MNRSIRTIDTAARGILILVLFTLTGAAGLGAQARLITELELYNSLYRGESGGRYMGKGSASVDLISPRDPQVGARLDLEFFPYDLYGEIDKDPPEISIKKAFVRTRLPGFKLTVGKTRLAWGQGVVFNSGDILFGSLSPSLDLSARELRSDTAWLTALNIPFGPFAFAEAVVLPPSLKETDGAVQAAEISRASAGGRIYFLAGNIKVEGGYLYKGETKVAADAPGHRPYLSLQGNIGPDWYLSGSLAVPTDEQKREQGAGEDWKKSINLSGGLFHIQEIDRNNSLNLRLEALCAPYLNWEEKADRDSLYALYLYPEIVWDSGNVSTSLRSVISPLDGSVMITAGTGWNLYQGLTLLAYLSVTAGEAGDCFAWDRGNLWESESDRVNGLSFMAGMRYKF